MLDKLKNMDHNTRLEGKNNNDKIKFHSKEWKKNSLKEEKKLNTVMVSRENVAQIHAERGKR